MSQSSGPAGWVPPSRCVYALLEGNDAGKRKPPSVDTVRLSEPLCRSLTARFPKPETVPRWKTPDWLCTTPRPNSRGPCPQLSDRAGLPDRLSGYRNRIGRAAGECRGKLECPVGRHLTRVERIESATSMATHSLVYWSPASSETDEGDHRIHAWHEGTGCRKRGHGTKSASRFSSVRQGRSRRLPDRAAAACRGARRKSTTGKRTYQPHSVSRSTFIHSANLESPKVPIRSASRRR
jgi:hypothetical protein